MPIRPKKADMVIAASVALAALALLLLGWQVTQALELMGHPEAMAAGRWYQLLILVGFIVCGVLSALLWVVVHNTRARHRAENQLQSMAHRLPGAFYVFRLPEDGNGTYEFLTFDVGNVLGVSREQLVQDANLAHRLVVPEDRKKLNAAIAHSRTALSPLKADFRIRKPDGEVRWVRTLAVPVRGSNKDVVWNGHLFDITEIRSTEQALRDATQRLEDAQSVAKLGDWTCDLATGVVTWSPQVYQLLGRDPRLGAPMFTETVDMVSEGDVLIANAFELAQATGQPQTYESTAHLPDGSVVALHVIVVSVTDGSGNVIGMRGTIQDITARKALEQQLTLAKEAADATNLAKSAFLATMSHEIRTPLNGMLGLLELISLTPVNPEIRTELEAVRESGQSLQRIIDDILDFSKVEAGKLEIRPEPTRLVDVVDSVRRVYAGSARNLGLDFRLHVDPDISPVLLLDALRLRQILGNFVSNAIKFTPKGGVELRVLSEGRDSELECLRFEVVDSGIGISKDEQRMLFQEFAQAHSIANRYGGTGLGLSISRRLAELMGGQVGMSSELGVGTTMTLHIVAFIANPAFVPHNSENQRGAPEQLPEKASLPEEASLPKGASLPAEAETTDSGMLILVVDDHPINRIVMRSQIKAMGHAAQEVGSGAEALEQWRTGKFSLVLTDLNMPAMSGYDLSRRIREAEAGLAGPRTPIIACSANIIPGVMQECLDAGMDDYISKPTSLIVMSEKLTRWLPSSGPGIEASSPPQPAPEGIEDTCRPTEPARETMDPDVKNELPVTQRARAHFRQVNDVDVMHLLEAIERGDMGTVTHKAHRIKGACGFIGAQGLASVCAMIEQAGREEDGPRVTWLMDAFHMELEQLNANLDLG
ncbi:PAS domain-containing hybrid sensor histidine kinase/response regulator [Thermomonas sp.]|uniref:hybrid sensor histidine kinase/response regulator n=1 Tax=Thermomonas sp. TaxID=1971895 RepID=UPI002488A073|nr:PAS domain-containing hybrid sensor histidine kinase/response regulator [Thermomonas sp.]MDI1251971.1 ATP-binding protein [Thermomonas sp.]